MRIALFSDVHGTLTALRAVLAAVEAHRPVHLVVAAGDHCLGGPRPAEVWDTLRDAGCVCLLGNEDARLWHDRPATYPGRWHALNAAQIPWTVDALGPERLAAMRAMPRSLRLSPAPGRDALIVHANIHGPYGWAFNATTSEATLRRLYGGAAARVACCGHHHEAAVREWDGITLVNVASVSLPVDGRPLAGFTLLDWHGDTGDTGDTEEGSGWRVRQFRVPYDAAAERAAEREAEAAGFPRAVP